MSQRFEGQQELTVMGAMQRKLAALPNTEARTRVLVWVCNQNGGEYLSGDEMVVLRGGQSDGEEVES